MEVKSITQTVFGTTVKGIQVQMTPEEAKGIIAMLGAGFSNPPRIGDNEDYKSKGFAADLSRQLGAAVDGRQ